MTLTGDLDLERDGRDWPHREASRLVDAGGSRWHVQVMGAGPVAVLLHGAGASSHSFRDLVPTLSQRFTTVALDLPGQGFSTPALVERMSLRGMAVGVAALLRELALEPSLMVGHSAGAAVAARICLDRLAAPRALVSLNGALLPLVGVVGALFAPAARLFADARLVPRLVARAARAPGAVERLVRDTGSTLDAQGIRLYRRLASSPGHVAATLRMMARWDLHGLERDLPALRVPLTLVVGEQDRTVAPRYSRRVHEMIPGSRLVALPGLGHLAHEEQPARVCEIIMSAAGSGPDGPPQASVASSENGHAS
jgi:magnesium chelatase accessory protein